MYESLVCTGIINFKNNTMRNCFFVLFVLTTGCENRIASEKEPHIANVLISEFMEKKHPVLAEISRILDKENKTESDWLRIDSLRKKEPVAFKFSSSPFMPAFTIIERTCANEINVTIVQIDIFAVGNVSSSYFTVKSSTRKKDDVFLYTNAKPISIDDIKFILK